MSLGQRLDLKKSARMAWAGKWRCGKCLTLVRETEGKHLVEGLLCCEMCARKALRKELGRLIRGSTGKRGS